MPGLFPLANASCGSSHALLYLAFIKMPPGSKTITMLYSMEQVEACKK